MKVIIKHNLAHKGIEIHFSEAISKEMRKFLGAYLFRYSKPQKMWYLRSISNRIIRFAKSVKNVLENDLPLSKLEIEPKFEQSIENLEKKDFSHIVIYFNNDKGIEDIDNWVVFEKNILLAQFLAEQFADSMYEGKAKQVRVHSGTFIREARESFYSNRLIESIYHDTPSLEGFVEVGTSEEEEKKTTTQITQQDKLEEKEQKVKKKKKSKSDTKKEVVVNLRENLKEQSLELALKNILIPKGVEAPFNTGKVYVSDAKSINEQYTVLNNITAQNIHLASAKELFILSQMPHPNDYGFSVHRSELLNIWEKKGEQLFNELNYPTTINYPFVNIHTGYSSVNTLEGIIGRHSNERKQWWSAVEHARPIKNLKEAITDITTLISDIETEMLTLVNPKTGKPKSKNINAYHGLEYDKGSYQSSLSVITDYLENQPNTNDMEQTTFVIGKNVQHFLPKQQLQYLRSLGIEGQEEMAETIAKLEQQLATIPRKPQGTDAQESIVYAHYFLGDSHWWILDYIKQDDMFFCYAVLNGDFQMAEVGYTALSELKTNAISIAGTRIKKGVELDFYWNPKTLKEVLQKYDSDNDDNDPNEIEVIEAEIVPPEIAEVIENEALEGKVLIQKKEHKKSKHSLNDEITDFIQKKDEMSEVYTEKDKVFISGYVGSGGLAKQGATGKGLLHEYYTDDTIVSHMWGLVEHYADHEEMSVLEPACGTGNFIKYAKPEAEVIGYEINPTARRISEILYPNATIIGQPFESRFFAGNIHTKDNFSPQRFDVVIGNPPYGEFSGKYAGMGEKKYTKALNYEHYFITRGLDLLKSRGILCYIIPSSFLQNGNKYNSIKEQISKKAILLDAYRLPKNMFPTTSIGTDIIVFKNTHRVVK